VFDHVTIRVSNRSASERFYDSVLAAIGIDKSGADEHYAEWDDFSLAGASDDKPVTRRLHVAFAAPSREHVDAFWRTGVEAGYREDGEPGPRPHGAFVLDPDGNNVELNHNR
jgi:catechol 2,3-dioxygenase-like lactoylglutathione lyase family enzyme